MTSTFGMLISMNELLQAASGGKMPRDPYQDYMDLIPRLTPQPSAFWERTGEPARRLEVASREMMGLPTHLRRYDPKKARRSQKQIEVAAREDMRASWASEDITEEESLPFRIRVAWRITRALAELRGCEGTDTLAEFMSPNRDNMDPWHIPTPVTRLSRADYRGMRPCGARIHELLEEASKLGNLHQTCYYSPRVPKDKKETEDGDFLPKVVERGLAFAPPNPPYTWLRSRKVGDTKRTETNHPAFEIWTQIVETLGRDLGLEAGTECEPDLGRLGFLPLVHPETAKSAWPDWRYLVMWENRLAELTLEGLTNGTRGVDGTYKSVQKELLEREHGLTKPEQQLMVRLAHRLARDQVALDMEDVRAVSILRLEDALLRAKNACELRHEIAIHKQLAIVQGLSRSEPQDEQTEFLNIVRKLDAGDSYKALDGPSEGKLTLDVSP